MTNEDTNPNPRAIVGANKPPIGALAEGEQTVGEIVATRLKLDYDELDKLVTELLEKARKLPATVDSDEEAVPFIALIKDLRDAKKRAEHHHDAEKAPVLAAGAAIDGYFFVLIEKLARRVKNGKAGAADVLLARLADYQERKLLAEQARLRREAQEAADKERAAQAAKAEAERVAEEARLAAARARKPEHIETKTAIADESAVVADTAGVNALMAGDKAEVAHFATFTPAADLARTRTDVGMATMGKEAFALVTDYDALDKAVLWPFIKRDAIDAALRAWAKTTSHKTMMVGASIGHKNKTGVR